MDRQELDSLRQQFDNTVATETKQVDEPLLNKKEYLDKLREKYNTENPALGFEMSQSDQNRYNALMGTYNLSKEIEKQGEKANQFFGVSKPPYQAPDVPLTKDQQYYERLSPLAQVGSTIGRTAVRYGAGIGSFVTGLPSRIALPELYAKDPNSETPGMDVLKQDISSVFDMFKQLPAQAMYTVLRAVGVQPEQADDIPEMLDKAGKALGFNPQLAEGFRNAINTMYAQPENPIFAGQILGGGVKSVKDNIPTKLERGGIGTPKARDILNTQDQVSTATINQRLEQAKTARQSQFQKDMEQDIPFKNKVDIIKKYEADIKNIDDKINGKAEFYPTETVGKRATNAKQIGMDKSQQPNDGINTKEVAKPDSKIDSKIEDLPKASKGETGYSSHGKWENSKVIHDLEGSDRGNTVDDVLLKDGYEAIWVTKTPDEAVVYNRDAEHHDLKEFPATENEKSDVMKVDLTNAVEVPSMDDGDGGKLYIRPKEQPVDNIPKSAVEFRPQTKPDISEQAKSLESQVNAKFNGIQEKYNKETKQAEAGAVLFTDNETKSTVAIRVEDFSPETVKARLDKLRKDFGGERGQAVPAPQPPQKPSKPVEKQANISKQVDKDLTPQGVKQNNVNEIQTAKIDKDLTSQVKGINKKAISKKAKISPETKQPYEMTRAEYIEPDMIEFKEGLRGPTAWKRESMATKKRREKISIKIDTKRYRHRRLVEEALSEGKIVPGRVLKDYPELQPNKAKTVKTVKTKPKDMFRREGRPDTKTILDGVEWKRKNGFWNVNYIRANDPTLIKKLDNLVKKSELQPKPETPTEAVKDIVEGKRESSLTTKVFKEKMLAELDKLKVRPSFVKGNTFGENLKASKKHNIKRYFELSEDVVINIPGDGNFALKAGADIKEIYERVKALTDTDRNLPLSTTPKATGTALKRGLESGEVEFTPNTKSGRPEFVRGIKGKQNVQIVFDGKHRMVKGTFIDIVPEFSTFIRKVGGKYEITEATVGAFMGDGKSQLEAVKNVKAKIKELTPSKTKALIKKNIDKFGIANDIVDKPTPSKNNLNVPKSPKIQKPVLDKTDDAFYAGMFGDPASFKALGKTIQGAVKEIGGLSDAMIERAKYLKDNYTVDQTIKDGVDKGKDILIEHHKNLRDAEFLHRRLTQEFEKSVPDKLRQMEILHSIEQLHNPKFYNGLSLQERGVVSWMDMELDKLDAFVEDSDLPITTSNGEIIDKPTGKYAGGIANHTRHLFHWWINPKTGQPYKGKYGKFSKNLPQAKQRKIPDYETGIEYGIEPVTSNVGDIIGETWESVMRAVQSREMFKNLAKIDGEKGVMITRTKKGKPKQIRMLERWDILQKEGLTDDYIRFDAGGILDRAIVFKGEDGSLRILKGAVGIQKDLYPFVDAYVKSPIYGNAMKAVFFTKALKLGFNLFHPVQLGMQELANFRIPFKNIPRGLALMKEGGEVVQLLHREGLELKGYEDINYDELWNFKATSVPLAIRKGLTVPLKLSSKFLFEVVQPGMKISFAVDKYNQLLPRFLAEGKTKEECARAVVRIADGHFSGEDYKRALLETNKWMVRMYFEAGARKAWQASFLSPTWQREHLMVAKDVGKSLLPNPVLRKLHLREMGPERSSYWQYFLGAMMIIGTANLMNYIFTKDEDGEGKFLWENPEGHHFHVRMPLNTDVYEYTNKNGDVIKKPARHLYMRPLKSVFEIAEFWDSPRKKLAGKLAPWLSGTFKFFFDRPFYRDKPLGEATKDWLKDAFLPITAQQWIDVAQYPESLAGRKKKAVEAGMSFFGMPTSTLSESQMKEFYYTKMAEAVRDGDNELFNEIKKKFKSLGYKYTLRSYSKYREQLRIADEKKAFNHGEQ